MKFIKTNFEESFLIEIEPRNDERGFFARTFCAEEFKAHGLKTSMVQSNLSYSKGKYTLRGMHYQTDNAAEAKLIRCNKGKILDVILDIRKESKTFGQYYAAELSDSNFKMLYVPEGFAHGFLTLTDDCYVSYQVSNFYTPGSELGVRWNDPKFNIKWPVEKPNVISEKDSSWADFQ